MLHRLARLSELAPHRRNTPPCLIIYQVHMIHERQKHSSSFKLLRINSHYILCIKAQIQCRAKVFNYTEFKSWSLALGALGAPLTAQAGVRQTMPQQGALPLPPFPLHALRAKQKSRNRRRSARQRSHAMNVYAHTRPFPFRVYDALTTALTARLLFFSAYDVDGAMAI